MYICISISRGSNRSMEYLVRFYHSFIRLNEIIKFIQHRHRYTHAKLNKPLISAVFECTQNNEKLNYRARFTLTGTVMMMMKYKIQWNFSLLFLGILGYFITLCFLLCFIKYIYHSKLNSISKRAAGYKQNSLEEKCNHLWRGYINTSTINKNILNMFVERKNTLLRNNLILFLRYMYKLKKSWAKQIIFTKESNIIFMVTTLCKGK